MSCVRRLHRGGRATTRFVDLAPPDRYAQGTVSFSETDGTAAAPIASRKPGAGGRSPFLDPSARGEVDGDRAAVVADRPPGPGSRGRALGSAVQVLPRRSHRRGSGPRPWRACGPSASGDLERVDQGVATTSRGALSACRQTPVPLPAGRELSGAQRGSQRVLRAHLPSPCGVALVPEGARSATQIRGHRFRSPSTPTASNAAASSTDPRVRPSPGSVPSWTCST